MNNKKKILYISLEDIEAKIRNVKGFLRETYKVKKIGVFGSYVRGEQEKDSDLDILVEFEGRIGLFKFMDLEEYLEDLFKTKVDLVSKKALKPRIGQNILSEVVMI